MISQSLKIQQLKTKALIKSKRRLNQKKKMKK